MSTSPYLEAIGLLREIELKIREVVDDPRFDRDSLEKYLTSLSPRINSVDNSKSLPAKPAYKQTFE
mgnify:CR=1 FL=1